MIITVAGGKGGTGKSMTATSLAYAYTQKIKTLLVDVDVECPNDHLLLNVTKNIVEPIYQVIPKWNFEKCILCGQCAKVCKQQSIAFVSGRKPAFVPDRCIGCKACFIACPVGAISEDRKEIGMLYRGQNYGVDLILGELKLGELASGEIVSYVRAYVDQIIVDENPQRIIVDAAAGIGCPVIASITGADYLVAVTEPTPSALHDLKRMVYLAKHFQIPCGIVINKFDLESSFCLSIEAYAKDQNIPVIGYIPYHRDFVDASLKMEPVLAGYPKYLNIFSDMIDRLEKEVRS
ncbi:MAG TPA: ATP-binding protein [Chlamydiales bacterium]|nr:ATP-binding protein [Chlamydiales bacterium]